MPVKDAKGTYINPGDIAIYNLSGTLAKGKVNRVHETWVTRQYANYQMFKGFVELTLIDGGTGYYTAGHISKVRNPESIYVISSAED